jgi:hypothetical protein
VRRFGQALGKTANGRENAVLLETLNRGRLIPDRINACKPRRVTIAGLFAIRPMIENLENPLQDMIQERVKRDPVTGSSVLRTAATDSMGCFIFPGLATVLLP